MISVILDEVTNGWVLTLFINGEKEQYIYESMNEVLEALEANVRSESNLRGYPSDN